MEGYYIVRNKDIDVKYDENGFFQDRGSGGKLRWQESAISNVS